MNIILLLSKKQETISLEVKTLQIEFAFQCPDLLIFPVKADSSYFSNIFMRAPTCSHACANVYFEISRIFLKFFEVSNGAPYLHTPWNKQNGIRTFLFVIFYLFQFFNCIKSLFFSFQILFYNKLFLFSQDYFQQESRFKENKIQYELWITVFKKRGVW